MSQLLALSAAVFYGVGDFIGGVTTRRLPVWQVAAWSQLFGLGVLAVGLVVVPAEQVMSSDLLWGAAAGVFGIIGLAILYSTLAAGSMTIVAPISGATAAAIPVLFDLSQGTTLTTRHWMGIALALGAVFLVGSDRSARGADLRLVGWAMLAGAGFGLFFIALSQTSTESGLWPLVGARATTIPIAFAVAVATRGAAIPRRSDRTILVLLGSVDMAANVAIALALQQGPLGINSVLSSLYPAFTAIAAIIVLRERPSGAETAGIVLAMGAIVALAL